MKRKFKNRRGESFIETLAAMFIISLGMLLLAGAIISAARVNNRAANETVQVVLPSDSASYETETGWFVQIGENSGDTLNITLYKAKPEGGGDNGLYYYTVAS